MSRDSCPSCNSSTGLGEYRCFKCGYINGYRCKPINYHIPDVKQMVLPEGLVFNPHNFHPEAIEWLAKAYIYNDVIIEQGIGYAPQEHKVFIPAYDSANALRFYQLRALSQDEIKYLTYGKMDYLIHYNGHSRHDILVIVEDHLSAIRLRKYCNVVALSGTSLRFANCEQLVTQYTNYILWLDPDEPGQDATKKNIDNLQRFATRRVIKDAFCGRQEKDYTFSRIDNRVILKDPKHYSDWEIVNIINREVANVS